MTSEGSQYLVREMSDYGGAVYVLTERTQTVIKVVLSHVSLSHQINFLIIKIKKRDVFAFIFPFANSNIL